MKVFLFGLGALMITGAALATCWFWGVTPFFRYPGGIHDSGWTAADLIRDRYPVHLISPNWVHPDQGDIIFPWMVAETKARLSVIFVGWFALLMLLHTRTTPRKSAIPALQPTATRAYASGCG